MLIDNVDEFKGCFTTGEFWRAFKGKEFHQTLPSDRDSFLQDLHSEIQKRQYYPSLPYSYLYEDKGAGITRIVPIFCVKDYCVYFYCIKKIESKIALNRVENTFGGWTLGGKMRRSEEQELVDRTPEMSFPSTSFDPTSWAKAYGDFNSKLYMSTQESEYNYVAQLDIANFYTSIRLDILEREIRGVAEKEHSDVIGLLFHFLNYWNRDNNLYNKQTVGIPQDAIGDFSRLLANFYLQPYDQKIYDLCQRFECKYLRYADDQFIFSNNKEELHQLILLFSKELNRIGLSFNRLKTRICKKEQLLEERLLGKFDIFTSYKDRENAIKVEQFVDFYIELLDNARLSHIKDRGVALIRRALSCPALKDIDSSKRARLVDCCLDDDFLMNARESDLDNIYELIDESEKPHFIERLDSLSQRLFHNLFHYNLIGLYKSKEVPFDHVEQRIRELDEFYKTHEEMP